MFQLTVLTMQISCRLDLMVSAEFFLWLVQNLDVLKFKKYTFSGLDPDEDLKSEMI